MDPDHVQRIAAGEVHTPEVDAAIKQEMDDLIASLSSKRRRKIQVSGERRRDSADSGRTS